MTKKIGGKTAGEVLCIGLCVGSTEQAVPVRWMGGLNKIVRNEHHYFALGIAAKILLLFAKDCSVKPDPKGNAQIIKIKRQMNCYPTFGVPSPTFCCCGAGCCCIASAYCLPHEMP